MTIESTAIISDRRLLVELVLPFTDGVHASDLLRLAGRVEAAGLDGVTSGEVAGIEAFSLLGAVAATTSRIRIESSVVPVLSRSPSLLAMAATTLAHLSGGRFVLGLGAGSPAIAGFHGVAFEHSLETMRTTVGIVRRALAGERIDELGGFRLASIEPVPVPVALAAVNDGMLRLAGRGADAAVLTYAGPEQLRNMAQVARDARRAAGVSDPFEVHTTAWLTTADDPEPARQRFKLQSAPYFAVPTYRRALVALCDEDAVDRIIAALHDGGRAAAARVVPDTVVDQLLMAGPRTQVEARLAEFAAAGCDGVRIVTLNERGRPDASFAATEFLADVTRPERVRPE